MNRAAPFPPVSSLPASGPLAPMPAPPGIDPATHAASIVAGSGTSFGMGMRILPAPRRAAMHAIYAFCRTVDDIADGDLPADEKLRLLAAWRGEIDRLGQGRPVSLIGRALLTPLVAFDLPLAEFVLLVEGMEMDAEGPVVAPPRARLAAYTRRVAGAVGLLSMRAFGAWRGAVSERFALALADACQLTNILRDVEEDAAIGRLYLPAELLARHGMPPDPAAAAAHPALPRLCAELGAEARAHFAEARGLIGAHARSRLAPALLMMAVYEGYLDRMERARWARVPLAMSKPAKLLAGLRYVLAPPR